MKHFAPEQIPPREGRAVRLTSGESIRIINTHGHQVVDLWAFNLDDLAETMSMEHSRAALDRLTPRPGDILVTNHRRPILTFLEDSSPGVHDTLIAPCDIYRYRGLGCTDYHRSCTDNLHEALQQIGLRVDMTPASWNLWMNIPVAADGALQWLPTVSKPGDYVVFRAEMDCAVVMSSCPQDIVAINANNPVEAHYQLLGA